jgi:hypothetical protein
MPRVRFEPTIPAFERAKTVHALDRTATVIGCLRGIPYVKITQISKAWRPAGKDNQQHAIRTNTRVLQCLAPCIHATRPTKLLSARCLRRVNRTYEGCWLLYQIVVQASELLASRDSPSRRGAWGHTGLYVAKEMVPASLIYRNSNQYKLSLDKQPLSPCQRRSERDRVTGVLVRNPVKVYIYVRDFLCSVEMCRWRP